MNSRERVEKVLSHQMPDYIPNGWGGCETAGMHVLAYDKFPNPALQESGVEYTELETLWEGKTKIPST